MVNTILNIFGIACESFAVTSPCLVIGDPGMGILQYQRDRKH